MFQTGGLFRTVPIDINSLINQVEIKEQLNLTQQLVIEAIKQIGDLRLFVFNTITEDQKTRLLQAIQALEARRAALVAAYKSQKEKPGFGAALEALGRVGTNFAAAYGAFVALSGG